MTTKTTESKKVQPLHLSKQRIPLQVYVSMLSILDQVLRDTGRIPSAKPILYAGDEWRISFVPNTIHINGIITVERYQGQHVSEQLHRRIVELGEERDNLIRKIKPLSVSTLPPEDSDAWKEMSENRKLNMKYEHERQKRAKDVPTTRLENVNKEYDRLAAMQAELTIGVSRFDITLEDFQKEICTKDSGPGNYQVEMNVNPYVGLSDNADL
jgi:hypothetical protein